MSVNRITNEKSTSMFRHASAQMLGHCIGGPPAKGKLLMRYKYSLEQIVPFTTLHVDLQSKSMSYYK